MLSKMETIMTAAENWLAQFERALAQPDDGLLKTLLCADSHWRDVLALTWNIKTVSGGDAIVRELKAHVGRVQPTSFRIDPDRTAPRRVTRAGTNAIEAIFTFETSEGRGNGVLRLIPDGKEGNTLKAWTLLTVLDEIKGHEDRLGRSRPQGKAYSRDFRGPNWLDVRKATSAYADHDPAVLVVGGGQAGLSTAARLTQLEVDTLIVDREQHIGDNWRNRYHAGSAQSSARESPSVHALSAHLAGLYPQRQACRLARGLCWKHGAQLLDGDRIRGGFLQRKRGAMVCCAPPRGRHETGDAPTAYRHGHRSEWDSEPSRNPDAMRLPGYDSALEPIRGWRCLEGQESPRHRLGQQRHIAQDLHSSGAKVTLVQRSSTLIVNVEPSAQLPYALYDEGPSLEDCDLIATSIPLPLARKSHILLTEQAKNLDKDLLDGLRRVGFKLDFGEDGTGWQFKYLTRGGGYYFNVGCSDLIVKGKIGLVQFSDIAAFVAEGARVRTGETLAADLVVLATGYKGQEHLVRKLFGNDVADRVGPIWGFGDGQELRNMFTRTAQPGLWFIAGSFAQCRIYSKYLGLQIKACELGLLPEVRLRPELQSKVRLIGAKTAARRKASAPQAG